MPESRFCQFSMPLYLNFYLFFCACVLVLRMFYATLFIFFFFLCQWLGFSKCSTPLYFYFFILCLYLCFANVLCLFICFSSFVPVA